MFNNNYIIISYATNSPKYIQYANELSKQLKFYNLNFEIDYLNFQYDTKVENCLYKSQFILDKFIKHNTIIIWMDIDSIINNNPTDYINNILNQTFDVGVVYTPELPHPATDAIHIYKNTNQALNFLKYRDKINKSGTLTLAHRSLDQTLDYYKNKDNITIINIRNEINTWFKAVFSSTNKILEYN